MDPVESGTLGKGMMEVRGNSSPPPTVSLEEPVQPTFFNRLMNKDENGTGIESKSSSLLLEARTCEDTDENANNCSVLYQEKSGDFKGFNDDEYHRIISECHKKYKKLVDLAQRERKPPKRCNNGDNASLKKGNHSVKAPLMKDERVKCKSESSVAAIATEKVGRYQIEMEGRATKGKEKICSSSVSVSSKDWNSRSDLKVKRKKTNYRSGVIASRSSAGQIPRRKEEGYCLATGLKRMAESDEEDGFEMGMLPPRYPKLMEESARGEPVCAKEIEDDGNDARIVFEKLAKTRKSMKRSGGVFEISDMLWSGRLDLSIMRFQMEEKERRHREEIQKLLATHQETLKKERLEREKLKQEIKARSTDVRKTPLQCIRCMKLVYSELGSLQGILLRYLCEKCLKKPYMKGRSGMHKKAEGMSSTTPPVSSKAPLAAPTQLQNLATVATLKSFGTDVRVQSTNPNRTLSTIPENKNHEEMLKKIPTSSANVPTALSCFNRGIQMTKFQPATEPSAPVLQSSRSASYTTQLDMVFSQLQQENNGAIKNRMTISSQTSNDIQVTTPANISKVEDSHLEGECTLTDCNQNLNKIEVPHLGGSSI